MAADSMDGDHRTEGIELEVYLRASAADEARRRQRAVLERIERLEADGVVAAATVRRWSNRIEVPVGIDPGGGDRAAVETFDELAAATEGTGITLEPGFEERNPVSGAERLLVFPVMALALRHGGDLRGIYPCVAGGRCDTVDRCLDALEAGEGAQNLPE